MISRYRLLGLLLATLTFISLIYWYQRTAPPASISFELPAPFSVGQEIAVPLTISTTVAMNAAEFYFTFPPDILEVRSIDQAGSFYELWITNYPRFDNEAGTLELAGGLPKPGFVGRGGLVATVYFRAKIVGEGEITLDGEKSRILANDGLGTEIERRVFTPIRFQVR